MPGWQCQVLPGESNSCVKGKLRLVLCKVKYRETRIARAMDREKL